MYKYLLIKGGNVLSNEATRKEVLEVVPEFTLDNMELVADRDGIVTLIYDYDKQEVVTVALI